MASHSALAAQPDISDALRQTPPPKMKREQKALPQIDGVTPLSKEAMDDGTKIEVKKIRIIGNRVFGTEELHDLVKSGEGKELTFGEIEALADRITKLYREKGYFIARAFLPAQDVVEGAITIEVVEGRYGKIVVNNDSLVRDSVLEGMLGRAKDSDPIRSKSLERALLNVNAVPGITVKQVDITAGETRGTSDLIVGVDTPKRLTGYIIGDNYGSVYTGRERLIAGIDLNSPLGFADKLSLGGVISRGGDLKNYRAAYSAPIGYDGMRVEGALSRTTYGLTDMFAPLNAVGTANIADLTFSYPIRRMRGYTIDSGLNFSYKDLMDKVRATNTETDKRSFSMSPNLSMMRDDTWFGMSGRNTASVSFTLGHLTFKDAPARALDRAGANTQGNYGRVNASVGRVMELSPRWQLSANARAQHALFNKNLDGSEDMSISGMTGVKVYPVDEAAAENAYLLTGEVQYALPLEGKLSSSVGLFTEWGHASMQNPVGANDSRTLSDVGLGLYTNYGNLFSTLHVALRTTGEADNDPSGRLNGLLQLGSTF